MRCSRKAERERSPTQFGLPESTSARFTTMAGTPTAKAAKSVGLNGTGLAAVSYTHLFQNVCPHDERACKIRKQTCRQENLHKRRCSQTDSAADKETLPTGESFRLMEGYRLQLILIFQQRLANPPRNLCRLAKAFALWKAIVLQLNFEQSRRAW